jgi:hypothetical protein
MWDEWHILAKPKKVFIPELLPFYSGSRSGGETNGRRPTPQSYKRVVFVSIVRYLM